MDQPSVQHDHVVTIIPFAIDASSIASSSAAAIDFQTLNSPSGVPREGIPTDVSTSATNTQGRSRAPRQQRNCRWSNLCSCMTIDFCSTSIQIILLVIFLSVFREEHPHVALQVWAIGYVAGCLAMLPLLYCSYKRSREQSNRLPQAISISPDTEVGESQTGQRQRFGKILKWLWRSLVCFFVLWFWVGVGIVDTHWASRKAPRLNRLCTVFLVFTYFRFILPMTIYIVMRWCGISQVPVFRERPRGASATVISALPTYKFHAQDSYSETTSDKEEDDVRGGSIGGDETRVGAAPAAAEVVECCVCLDPYEDGVQLKELPCAHHFHVKCIDRWLKINGSCPVCKSEVGSTSRRACAT